MPRDLDMQALTGRASYYAGLWLTNGGNWPREKVLQDMYKITFADEFDVVVEEMRKELGKKSRDEFDRMSKDVFKPRTKKTLADLLKTKLAIDPDGQLIERQIGTTVVGMRLVGYKTVEVEAPWSIRRRKMAGLDKSHRQTMMKTVPVYWPIYAGEAEARVAGHFDVVDELPDGTPGMPVGALNTRISNECALLGCDAIVDNLDEVTGAAVIQGRSGAQPADPDTAATGTLLFTLVCSATAFGAAADANPGAIATAAAITSDTSADATGTLGYVRASSSNDGATPLDDHIDGEAGTASADWIFNTLSITAGSQVDGNSWTVTLPES